MRFRMGALALMAMTAMALPPVASAEYEVTIRRTDHGIPHVIAGDWGDLAYGYGYALAEDNICTLADTYVTVSGERSKFFGPGNGYTFQGNGFAVNNLNSDFFFQRIIDEQVVEGLIAQPPPDGPVPEIVEGVEGYVAGYNAYLAETGVENIPDPTCVDADWVRPITEMDAYRRFYQLALLASGGVAIDGIGGAQPPTGPGSPLDPDALADALEEAGLGTPLGGLGSNAYGLGSEATETGSGIVLGNPHFPWQGSERFYQAHLTIPGELNVSGAGLFGVPLILIGHTDNMAWSHTVSTAYRFTPFEETLHPLDPTQYAYDGEPGGFRDMEEDDVTVTAQDPGADPAGCTPDGGGMLTCERTLYSTHHGPVFDDLVGVPLPWTPATAFAMGDANAANFRYLNHFFETNQAQSVEELDDVLHRNQGIPWVNTIAADSSGEAYYADISVVPHVTDEHAQTCNTPVGVATYAALRLPVLDGALAACEWGNDPDAIQPGTFGPSNMPSLFRDDYVTNSNDSYWLSNPEQPLEGYDLIIGDEQTERSLRTRSGLVMVEEELAAGGGFSVAEVQDAVFANRQYAGELLRDELVDYCEANPTVNTTSGPVDVSGACPVLASWDLHDDLDSDGALLFRRFASRLLASPGGVLPPPAVFANPFDVNDPVDTPNGLNEANPNLGEALGQAVNDLDDCGIPLDAPLREYQSEARGSDQIPIHGGPGTLGVFNAINVSWDGSPGCTAYNDVDHGSSFVMVTGFGEGGCLVDRSILTYSLSENPDSPYYRDQTELFSEKQWVDVPWFESEIAAGQISSTALNGGYTPPDSAEPDCNGGGDPAPGPISAPSECTIEGTPGRDKIVGTPQPDVICAGAGRDRVRARGDDDVVRGGAGRDRLSGNAGKDTLFGEAGADVLRGGPGKDRLIGGPGRDQRFP